jgi:hypothetical protein
VINSRYQDALTTHANFASSKIDIRSIFLLSGSRTDSTKRARSDQLKEPRRARRDGAARVGGPWVGPRAPLPAGRRSMPQWEEEDEDGDEDDEDDEEEKEKKKNKTKDEETLLVRAHVGVNIDHPLREGATDELA